MDTDNAATALVRELEGLFREKLGALFQRYGLDVEELLTPLRWKPLVLIIGNYSSGKSTFINELLGTDVQRTGQAPTDDSFTILSAPENGESEGDVLGNTVISDERLPFEPLRRFGESLISHLRMKKVSSPVVEHVAIIDTPGMLDSVTEKDRGYDYLGVVGELARVADVILLMFDPHKAGTIKETYKVIRGTLPGSTGEDRILYVLNRIDECDNPADLLRSYGALCWNLSQMTGRKDMPRIFLTFSPEHGRPHDGLEAWANERADLKKAVESAPRMRLNHILQEVDRLVRALGLEVEALASFQDRFRSRLKVALARGGLAALGVFLFGDLILKLLTGIPESPMLQSLLTGSATMEDFILPAVGGLLAVAALSLYIQRLLFPATVRSALADMDSLVTLDTEYKKDLWERVRERTHKLISEQARSLIWGAHRKSLKRIQDFLDKDLPRFYQQIQKDAG